MFGIFRLLASLKNFLSCFLSLAQMEVYKIGRQYVRIETIKLLNSIDEKSSVLVWQKVLTICILWEALVTRLSTWDSNRNFLSIKTPRYLTWSHHSISIPSNWRVVLSGLSLLVHKSISWVLDGFRERSSCLHNIDTLLISLKYACRS